MDGITCSLCTACMPEQLAVCLTYWPYGRAFAAVGSAAAPAPPPVSLDTFLAVHTSEDNASFSDIMADTAEKKRQKQPWLHEDKNQVRHDQQRPTLVLPLLTHSHSTYLLVVCLLLLLRFCCCRRSCSKGRET